MDKHVDQVAERFRAVLLECLPWQDVVAKYDSDETLMYCDPPYLQSTRTTMHQYEHEMSEAEHEELLRALQAVRSKVMLSGYESELYAAYLGKWRMYRYEVRCTASASRRKPTRVECVWLNYDEMGHRLAT